MEDSTWNKQSNAKHASDNHIFQFFSSICLKNTRTDKTRDSVRSYLSSEHSKPNYSFLKWIIFSHSLIRNLKCNVYFASSPILIHSSPPASGTVPMLSFLTLEPSLLWRFIYISTFINCKGKEEGKKKAQGTVTSSGKDAWSELRLCEIGYFLLKYGSIIIFLSTCT